MNNTIGWAFIGTSDGLQAKKYGCIANFDISRLVDIDNNYIKLFPDSEMICLLKENRNNTFISYYIKYHYAKEIRSNRTGTFCGSVLVLVNNTIKGEIALKFLDEMFDNLKQYLNAEQRFTSNISNIDFSIPSSLQDISKSLEPISPSINVGTDECLLAIADSEKNTFENFFDFVLQPSLTSSFSKIYASSNRDVISYAKERKKIKVTDFSKIDLEIQITELKKQNFNLNEINLYTAKKNQELEGNYIAQVKQLNDTITQQSEAIKQLQNEFSSNANSKQTIEGIKKKENDLLEIHNKYDSLKNRFQDEKNSWERQKSDFEIRINQLKQNQTLISDSTTKKKRKHDSNVTVSDNSKVESSQDFNHNQKRINKVSVLVSFFVIITLLLIYIIILLTKLATGIYSLK